jgi:DNA-binding NarL/FixJ family response regulator
VFLFSMFLTAETIDEAQALGVTGFITKSAPLEHLLAALRAVTAGKTYLSPDIRSHLKARQSPRKRLPPREEEVFQLLGQGFRLTEIADQLALSVKTVDTYVGRLCRDLGFDSRKALIRHAIERHQKRF